jgi:hypothetical protein
MSNRRRRTPPPATGLRWETVLVVHPDTGRRALYVVPQVPEDAPPRLREGIARRRLAAREGCCRCGAEGPEPFTLAATVAPGSVNHTTVEHENDCPAGDEQLVPLIRRWLR